MKTSKLTRETVVVLQIRHKSGSIKTLLEAIRIYEKHLGYASLGDGLHFISDIFYAVERTIHADQKPRRLVDSVQCCILYSMSV